MTSLVGGGGEGQGGSQSPASHTPFSRLPPFIVVLLLSSKSRCLTPYSDSNRECFGLVQNNNNNKKNNCGVNRTTPHFPARSLKQHSFDTSLHHAAKSSLQCFVNHSRKERAPKKVFYRRIFPHHVPNRKTNKNGL